MWRSIWKLFCRLGDDVDISANDNLRIHNNGEKKTPLWHHCEQLREIEIIVMEQTYTAEAYSGTVHSSSQTSFYVHAICTHRIYMHWVSAGNECLARIFGG